MPLPSYTINKDISTGDINISETLSSSILLLSVGDSHIFNIVDLQGVNKIKAINITATGLTKSKKIEVSYRISRDTFKWTTWLDASEPINNFPEINYYDPLYLDVKVTRTGGNVGSISLSSYEIVGTVERDIRDGVEPINIAPNSDPVVIKPPYVYKVFRLTDIEVVSTGSPSIEYRFSQDYGRTVSKWTPLTKENLTTERINPIRFFQIEYKVTATSQSKIYDINLLGEFQNVTLDYTKTNLYGIREDCVCDNPYNKADSPLPQLTAEQTQQLYNPNQQNQAIDLLNKMSNDAANMFGHTVTYYLTDPDQNGIDNIMHEYQLFNVVCSEDIKVLVNNNEFPSNEIVLNAFDLSLFDVFEIHITKDMFKKTFGVDKRPNKEDFLYFCSINRMFQVEHAQQFRSFNNAAVYYKVMLKKYNKKANVVPINDIIRDEIAELTNNSTINDLINLEVKQDIMAVSNKDIIKPLTQDPIRLKTNARIEKFNLENSTTTIAKTYYDLSSVPYDTMAVEYTSFKNWYKVSDNFSYLAWFNLTSYITNDYYNFFTYQESNTGIKIDYFNGGFQVKVNSTINRFEVELQEDTWYSIVVNLDQRQRKLSVYLYKRFGVDDEDALTQRTNNLEKVYSLTLDITPSEFEITANSALINGSDMNLTNIRVFIDIIEEPMHVGLLNQYIIGDSYRYIVLADNANKKLVLPNFKLGDTKFE
jgi:hypothetical protein